MSQLVDKLADLTGLRDRDALDLALVSAIHDLLQPQTAAIYRVVGEAGNERWLTTAQIKADQRVPTFDSAWSDLLTLPRLTEYPLRQQASVGKLVMQSRLYPGITVFPVSGNPGAIGVLAVATQEPLSEELSRLVSGVLRLYLNFQSLLDYGERDALTELLNRKTFDGAFLKATLAQQVAVDSAPDKRRDTSCSGSFWLAMLDIDHFKHVNDNFGHLIGDEVLLLLARLMRNTFRFHDQLYRFGSEEFVVLMHCAQRNQAAVAFERLRKNTEQHNFPQLGRITISVGFTEIRPGDSPSGAFERADKAVYFAKEHGRNQVCGYETLVDQGRLAAEMAPVGDIELF